MLRYKVREGDCISSIAYRFNLHPDTIWNDPANAELKAKRKDLNTLFPGDVLELRRKEMKDQPISTGQRHRFRKKAGHTKLVFQMLDADGEPRVGTKYVVEIGQELFSGKTDGDGKIQILVRPNAKRGKLCFDVDGDKPEEYDLEIGALVPISEIEGVQERLNNLGFDCGDVDGIFDTETEQALRVFQAAYDLSPTGAIDDETLAKLEEIHGC